MPIKELALMLTLLAFVFSWERTFENTERTVQKVCVREV